MRIFTACLLALALVSTGALPALAAPTEERPIAVMRILDKMTARVEEIEVPIERPLKFGTLIVTAHSCKTTLPEETPESAVFLDIAEMKAGEAETPVFRGWMFASSPALSGLEHPVYDLWVIGCKGIAPNQAGNVPPVESVSPSPAPAPASPLIPAPHH
jgi:hypothetical protein